MISACRARPVHKRLSQGIAQVLPMEDLPATFWRNEWQVDQVAVKPKDVTSVSIVVEC